MPKLVEYPRNSLKRSLLMASAIDSLGGSSTEEMVAHKLGKKLGGSFSAWVSAATKYGLIRKVRGQLSVTELYRQYKLAYTDEERLELLRTAFLNVPLFGRLHARFVGKKIPIEFFEKLLTKEFDVDERLASRVAKYFLEGAKEAGLLTPDNTVVDSTSDIGGEGSEEHISNTLPITEDSASATSEGMYTVRVLGPGIDSSIGIAEDDDFLIVEAILQKVRRRISKKSITNGNSETDE